MSSGAVDHADDASSSSSSSSSSEEGQLDWEKVDLDALKRDTEALAAWVQQLLDGEATRLKQHGVRVLPLKTQSVVTSRDESSELVHTVSVASGLDFATVESIFLGPLVACPLKAGFTGLTMMLWTEKGVQAAMPFMLAVLVPAAAADSPSGLRVWRFVNDKDETVKHTLNQMEELGQDATN